MSDNLHRDKTLALAAMFQAAGLVNDLARRGRCDTAAESALVRTSLVMDTDDVAVIYGSADSLRPGLEWLRSCLSDRGLESAGDLVRLVLSMVQAEKHFRQHGEAQAILRRQLDTIAAVEASHTEAMAAAVKDDANDANDANDAGNASDTTAIGPSLTERLAKAYVDSLGILRFRVQIHGDARHLQSAGTPERIRAILLAGIRAAWLWQRMGGRRWHLLFTRSQVLEEINEILKSV